MKKLLTVFALCAAVPITGAAALIEILWDANPTSDYVMYYNVFRSTNVTAKPTYDDAVSTQNFSGLTNVFSAVGSVTNGLSLTVSLLPGTNYFYVTAVNVVGESDPSELVWWPDGSGGTIYTHQLNIGTLRIGQ